MISSREKKHLTFKMVATTMFTLFFLAVVRIFIIYEDFIGEGLFYFLLLKEILFSLLSLVVVMLVLYGMMHKEFSHISAKAKKYAFTDGLTGLYNRHYLNDFLEKFSSLRKEDCSFAVIFIDIDNFKAVNDTHGHKVGDCVLKNIAAKLEASTRTKDILCRFGGEEFIIIYSGISKEDVLMKSKMMRIEIQNMQFACKQTNITVSMGLSFGNVGDDIHQVIEEADKALYIAKKSGKNRVEVFTRESLFEV